jgi:glycosyltransferase involved in cell wall biosynthesis
MRIAMLGTRGVPARYGGFETAVEEIGRRLADRGHEVTVYCRGEDRSRTYLEMKRVRLPAVRGRSLETLSHSLLSAGHLCIRGTDAALVFNAANAPVLPLLRARRIPTAVHVDGLEWRRAKWGPTGRRYYLAGERLCVRWADTLIADSMAIQDYYRQTYRADSRYLAYGAPPLTDPALHLLEDHGLRPGGYHLVVARLEPENNVHLIIRGYERSGSALPLVVVGSVPYPREYHQDLAGLARHAGARMLGSIWDQKLLDALYAGAMTYLHGHSVGGTNPSLLRAIGASVPVVAYDVAFNREVVNGNGLYFDDEDSLADAIREVEAQPELNTKRGRKAHEEVSARFRWDLVADGYEQLCRDLAAGPR